MLCTEQIKGLLQSKPAAIPSHRQSLYCNFIPLHPFQFHPFLLKPLSNPQSDMRSFPALQSPTRWWPFSLPSSGDTFQWDTFQWGHMPPLCRLATFMSPACSPLCAKPKLVTLLCKTFATLRARVCHPNSGALCHRTEATPLEPFRSGHTWDCLTALMCLSAPVSFHRPFHIPA